MPPAAGARIGVGPGRILATVVELAEYHAGLHRSVPLVELELHRDVYRVRQLLLGERSVDAERDAHGAARAAVQAEASVLLPVAHGPDVPHPYGRHQKPDSGVSHPEGRQPFEVLGNLMAEALTAHDGIDWLVGDELVALDGRCDMGDEGLAESIDPLGPDFQTGGGPVPAVALEVPFARVERRQQVESRNAAAGPAPPSLGVEPDQHGRNPVAFRELRGGDAHHPWMPARAGEHHRRRRGQALGETGPGRLCSVHDLPLRRSPLAVDAVQLGRERARPRLVRRQHQLDPGVRAVEASGRVDARPESEREVPLVEPFRRDLGCGTQRAEAGAPTATRDGEALAHQRSVLAAQRDEVGDGCERDEIQLRLSSLRPK